MFTTADDAIVWQHIHRTRFELVAYLESLTVEQWDRPSLCEGWKIRDVVAHLILEYHYTARNSWFNFIRSGLRVNTFMRQTATTLGKQPPEELLQTLRSMISEQHTPAGIPAMNALVDLLVHEQDIRIPLNQPNNMDMAALQLIFAHWEPGDYNFGERITGLAHRLRGLRFTMSDLQVSKGSGAEVIGSAQDILLAAAGRGVRLENLRGEGLTVLRQRLQ